MLDCSRVATGGAIQNALAVLHNARHTSEHEWHVIVSDVLWQEMQPRSADGFASLMHLEKRPGILGKIPVGRKLLAYERRVEPDVVFSPAGPVYWRPRARQVVAYAIPHLIYPELDVYRGENFATRLRARAVMHARLRSFRQADTLVVQTDTVKRRLIELHGFARDRILVVKNSHSPLFLDAIRLAAPKKEARTLFSVLVPSAHYPHKNLSIVPRVARLLESQGSVPFEFVFTLDTASAPWAQLEKLARGLGVGSRVRSLGNVPHADLGRHYVAADAVFLPTWLECSSAVYPESFIAEVPLVTSNLDFAHELCGDAALYFDPASAEQAALSILRLQHEPGLAADLVARGRRVLSENYPSPAEKWRRQLEAMTGTAI